MEGGRQWRRFGRGQGRRTLLPLNVRRLSHTVSCWYCDYKTSALNESLFRVGRRHARLLRVWFSVGIGFNLTAMLGIYLILLWELASLLHLYNGNSRWLSKLLTGSLSGIFPSVFGLSTTLADVGYMCISTIISVSAHEFGHALAAARFGAVVIWSMLYGLDHLTLVYILLVKLYPKSQPKEIGLHSGIHYAGSSEGIQIEYIAVFVAILFPGALVAFNYEVLQALPKFATLRIYCAGIWHNAACCAVCGLTLFLLPLILYPFYIHGEIPMVLDVPSSSPLSGFLSSGDLVMSMDGISIRNPQDWMEVAAHIHDQTLRNSNISNSFHFTIANGNKGYCVPSSLMEASKDVVLTDDQSTCPNDYAAFTTLPCSNSSMLDDGSIADKYQNVREGIHCLIAKDIVKLRKCGDGWANSASNRSSCPCSEDDTCLAPVQIPGLTWVEITYLRPYSSDCWQLARNSFVGMKSPNFDEKGCSGAFVFVGDVLSMAFSIQLTAYRPRWLFSFVARLPNVLERIFVCTFHVSLALALLNSLPVTICYLRVLGPRMKERVLRLCLLAGTLISIFALLKIFLLTIFFAEET